MDLAVAIQIGSPNSTLDKVRVTLNSIITNIGTDNYKIIVAMTPYIREEIKKYVYNLKREKDDLLELMPEKDYYWADFINEAIDRSSECKYFIKSHDDIELLTPGFYQKITNILAGLKEPAGWVSFNDKDYLNGHWAPSTRPGFHKDVINDDGWNRQKLFQFHSLPEGWWKPPAVIYGLYLAEYHLRSRLHLPLRAMPLRSPEYYASLPYDLPSAPVKCHAPFNHFVLIEMDKLKQIGKCERWSNISLLVDEDWGLRALQAGFNNIWIPAIEYIHFRPYGASRASGQIAENQKSVHTQFALKWGFSSGDRNVDLDSVRKRYRNTKILWSMDRNSYDWDYIK